jgi:hypothetical protein
MRKLLLGLSLFFVFSSVNSLEINNSISLGNIGVGTSFLEMNIVGNFITWDVQEKSGWGINISPLHFRYDITTKQLSTLTFINAKLYYNFLKDDYIIWGPFVSVNTLEINKVNFFEFQSGITFSFWNDHFSKINLKPFLLEIFGIQAGYKYSEQKNSFYLLVECDLPSTLSLLFSGYYDEAGISKINH